jgi:DNA-binding MarR family transcriptional regulator
MDNLLLDEQLCFKFYAISRQITNLYRPLLEALDITYPQYLVMLILWEEESATVKKIGNRLQLDSGTLTPLLKRLEQKKLLTRTRDANDERNVIIRISNEGMELRKSAEMIPDAIGSCFSLPHTEYLQFKEVIGDLHTKLITK